VKYTDSVDEDQLAILFATILINEYPDLIGSEDTNRMRTLLVTLQKMMMTPSIKSNQCKNSEATNRRISDFDNIVYRKNVI
jgi:hypothetical protein